MSFFCVACSCAISDPRSTLQWSVDRLLHKKKPYWNNKSISVNVFSFHFWLFHTVLLRNRFSTNHTTTKLLRKATPRKEHPPLRLAFPQKWSYISRPHEHQTNSRKNRLDSACISKHVEFLFAISRQLVLELWPSLARWLLWLSLKLVLKVFSQYEKLPP